MGHLLEYTRLPNNQWINLDLTTVTQGAPVIGSPVPIVDPVTHFQNVYVNTPSGPLIEYIRLLSGQWTTLDVAAASGYSAKNFFQLVGSPRPFVDLATGLQTLFVESANNDLIELIRAPNGGWTWVNLTATAQAPMIGSEPVPFADGSAELLFATSGPGHLWESRELPGGRWTSSDLTQTHGLALVGNNPAPIIDPVTGFLNVYDTANIIQEASPA